MKTIWKYRLQVQDEQTMEVPLTCGRQIKAGMDMGAPCLWCLVETEAPTSRFIVRIVMTGRPVPDDSGEWLATLRDGSFVWHVFAKFEDEVTT